MAPYPARLLPFAAALLIAANVATLAVTGDCALWRCWREGRWFVPLLLMWECFLFYMLAKALVWLLDAVLRWVEGGMRG